MSDNENVALNVEEEINLKKINLEMKLKKVNQKKELIFPSSFI